MRVYKVEILSSNWGLSQLDDIYDYMGALNTLEKGESTTITILRNGEEITLELQL